MARTTELRLPAHRDYLVVAKRSAAAMGTVAGFDMDAVDDLTIAVSEAFENAIACLERSGVDGGEVRLTFKEHPRGIDVNVRSTWSREAEMEARERARAAEAREHARRHVELARQREAEQAAADLALRLMGLFVDDSSYRVDERTGALRVRLTKYRVS